jgi:hypothetical protein
VPPVSYEVTARVRKDLVASFASFMTEKHIREVLQTGAFVAASFERLSADVFRTRYSATSLADVERYVNTHSARLRADVAVHFPEGVEFTRETWTRIEEFDLGPTS